MTDKTSLGDRMKKYENVSRIRLTPRMPMIIRVDGRAFHTYTRRFKPFLTDPWSRDMRDAMTATAVALMKEISGAKIAYLQSDEISILVTDYDKLSSQAWFDKSIQKVASVSASIATAAFNEAVLKLPGALATFDARCFVLPKSDVTNYFVWRQRDAEKNSVSMLAQYHFSHTSLQGKSGSDKQDMLMAEHEINWNDCDVWQKRGWCVVRETIEVQAPEAQVPAGVKLGPVMRPVVQPDWNIPIFSKERDYIDQYVDVDNFPGNQKERLNREGVE